MLRAARLKPVAKKARSTRWYVYLLKCADGSLYCGITNELVGRFIAHNSGKGAKYTRARRPLELVYAETAADFSAALKREYAIKQLSRREKDVLCGVA